MADKQLNATSAAGAFQKEWFANLRRRVFDERQPYALLQADVPFELFDLLDIPAVSNQWWAAIVAAKRQAPAYLDAMAADGHHDGLCHYCSLGYASTKYRAVQEPPWGGLPTPRLLCARLTCDCIHRVFSLWADEFGSELFEIDHPGAGDLPPRWWELGRHRWRELVEPHRLAFVASTLERLVERLETIRGRSLDRGALRQRLESVNQQEEIFDAVRELIASAPEVPVRMTEQISNVMATQWVRGTDWALAHARAFHDEVRQRVDAGIAACPGERARLMWVGVGLWHDTDFYTAFEESHRAVFVWSMYLAFGPDGYIRYGLDDPMAAKAVYGLDAKAAGIIISTGYVTAIVVNIVVGYLVDRFNRLVVLGGVFVLLAFASSSMIIENLTAFRVSTAAVIGLGFAAANQLYGLAGTVTSRGETGNAMGIVSLGAGLFGYFGPQMLGILRDSTGSFAAGFYAETAPGAHGFEYFFGFRGSHIDFYHHNRGANAPDLWENDESVYPQHDGEYMTDLITDRSIRFIEKSATANRPFFVDVAYNAPHWPYQPPGKPSPAPGTGAQQLPQQDGTATRADYVAMVESVDQGVGKILQALERLRLTNNTIVIFTNDNGGEWLSNGGPLFNRKWTTWEGGIRVPALIKWPGHIQPGRVSDQVGITMDLSASIVAASGATVPANYDGINLFPILEGRAPAAERTLYWRTDVGNRSMRSVRSGDWKLVVDGNHLFVFNVRQDVGERNDLTYRRADIANRLRPMITRWEQEMDAEARVHYPDAAPAGGARGARGTPAGAGAGRGTAPTRGGQN